MALWLCTSWPFTVVIPCPQFQIHSTNSWHLAFEACIACAVQVSIPIALKYKHTQAHALIHSFTLIHTHSISQTHSLYHTHTQRLTHQVKNMDHCNYINMKSMSLGDISWNELECKIVTNAYSPRAWSLSWKTSSGCSVMCILWAFIWYIASVTFINQNPDVSQRCDSVTRLQSQLKQHLQLFHAETSFWLCCHSRGIWIQVNCLLQRFWHPTPSWMKKILDTMKKGGMNLLWRFGWKWTLISFTFCYWNLQFYRFWKEY